jgi:dynein heavy chain
MAFAHMSVNDISRKFLLNEKRYNYTTPKSFLALISLYKEMLERKAKDLTKSTDRLENGLTKLQSTAAQVDDLKAKLAFQEVELKAKNEEAERLIERVGIDTEKVNAEKAVAAEEEKKVAIITKEVTEKQVSCETDLKAAEPALAAASEALNTLNKANLTELKSFGSPSDEVVSCTAAVMVLLSPPGKIAKDRSWKAAKNMMAKVDAFLDQLINFNKENIDQSNLEALKPYLEDPNFNADFMKSKSVAAAGLCSWVVSIVKFYYVYCDVEPKRKALEQANSDLQAAQTKLAGIKAKIAELDANLADLRAKFEHATAEKLRCEEEARSTQETIALANRLVNGLASEKVRWSDTVSKFKEQEKTLPGDVLLSAAFVSYVGCFSKKYREELYQSKWVPYLTKEMGGKIPLSPGIDPLDILTNSAEIARWNNEGLPNDRISVENAVMVTNCKRWPLIIDPQLQGICILI